MVDFTLCRTVLISFLKCSGELTEMPLNIQESMIKTTRPTKTRLLDF